MPRTNWTGGGSAGGGGERGAGMIFFFEGMEEGEVYSLIGRAEKINLSHSRAWDNFHL
jgi:hypothetical protein